MKLVLNNTFKSGNVLYKSFEVQPPVSDLTAAGDVITELTVDYDLENGLVAVFAKDDNDVTLEEAILVMNLDANLDPYSDKADKTVFAELFQREVQMEISDYALELLALLQDD